MKGTAFTFDDFIKLAIESKVKVVDSVLIGIDRLAKSY